MMKDIKKLKILIPIHLLPNDTSFHTLYFETVFSQKLHKSLHYKICRQRP